MQEEFYERIRGILSVERLEAYGDDGAERVVVLARYLLNMALCESLYAPLQCFEVALRNSMHSCLSSIAGCENWYNSGTIQFTDWAGIQIKNAERQIVKNRKPITPGRIVAELNFGFWTSLLEDHYERNTNFLPKGIKTVFPQLPKSQHNRKRLKRRLDSIRTLRNRVFHHERIIHWSDLSEQHLKILDTIGWIDRDLFQLTETLDRFDKVQALGLDPWLDKIKANWVD